MDDLILRALEGDLSAGEYRLLADWRAAHPDHERRYQELARLSRLLASAGAAVHRPPPPTAASVIARSGAGAGSRSARAGDWRMAKACLAAAAGLVAMIGGLLASRGLHRAPAPFGISEAVAGPTEATTVHLADGSVVRLAPASRLTADLTPGRRDLWLEGTGFFAVAHRPGVPFVVRTASGSATALGTRFELQADGSRLRVVVIEGRVAVRDGHHEVEVGGGEMTVVGPGLPPGVMPVENPREAVRWVGRVLLFQDTPLAQAAREVADLYGLRVVIEDSVISSHLVTATFADQPADQVVGTICRILDLDCALVGDVARLDRRR